MKSKKKSSSRKTQKANRVISDYDQFDTTEMVDSNKPLKFEALGLRLPDRPPTEVVSIRLPSYLLNQIRTLGSQQDIPYQALMKLFLADDIKKSKKDLRT